MLPTEKANYIGEYEEQLYLIDHSAKSNHLNYQHLYLISDDKIKENDWYYYEVDKKIHQCKSLDKIDSIWCKKVIASTDSELHGETYVGSRRAKHLVKTLLPTFSEDFIKAYVKANGIDEGMVEYEKGIPNNLPEDTGGKTISFTAIDKLKLRDDNTVIISEAKTTYSKKEVEKLCKDAYYLGRGRQQHFSDEDNKEFFKKWINNIL